MREFRCMTCGRVDKYETDAKPIHCGVEMQGGETDPGRKGAFRIDLVKLQKGNPKRMPEFDDQWEVWLLWANRPGKKSGESEQIGFLGKSTLGMYYPRMMPGLPSLTRAFFEKHDAVLAMTEIATSGAMVND